MSMFGFTILFCLHESEKILTRSQSLSKKKTEVLVPNVTLCLLLKQEKVSHFSEWVRGVDGPTGKSDSWHPCYDLRGH